MHAFRRLPAQGNDAAAREIASLAAERDPEIYYQSLNRVAGRMIEGRRPAEAFPILAFVADVAAHEAPTAEARAREELKVLSGGGGFGRRVENHGLAFVGESANLPGLIGMAVAGGVFFMGRGLLLSRLLGSAGGALTRGLGAQALAAAGAFALEAPAFALTANAARRLFGGPSESLGGKDLASAYLNLGLVKLLAFGGAAGARRFGAQERGQAVAGGIGSCFGLWAGQSLERAAGWRPAAGFDRQMLDAFAAWLQFRVGGHLAAQAVGPTLSNLQSDIHLRVRALGNARPAWQGLLPPRAAGAAPSTLATSAAAWGAVLCAGCSESSANSVTPFLIGVGLATTTALLYHLREAARTRATKEFHDHPNKDLVDFAAGMRGVTGLTEGEARVVLTTMMRYGAPRPGIRLEAQAVFKKVAVDLLRLPPVKRNGGLPTPVPHYIPQASDPERMHSEIFDMPLAYCDRIRAWARQHLKIDENWLAEAWQIRERQEILVLKLSMRFPLQPEQAERLLELIAPEPRFSGDQTKGILFDREFPAAKDPGGFVTHLEFNRQAALSILRQAGIAKVSIPYLKEIILFLAAECRMPLPIYSMRPDYAERWTPWGPMNEQFTDHDWSAVFRLRDALWGPWRLPWEVKPAPPFNPEDFEAY